MLLLLRFLHFYSKVKLVSYSVLTRMIYGKKRNKAIIYNHLFLFLPLLPIQEDHEEEGQKNRGSTYFMAQIFGLDFFLSFAGFFDNPALDTKAHDHLGMRLETNINLGKKVKLDRPPLQRIKWKIGGRSVHHPPPHAPLLDGT